MKGFRTIVFNAIMGIGAFLQSSYGVDIDASGLVEHLTSFEGLIQEVWLGGNVLLRYLTNSPIFKRS